MSDLDPFERWMVRSNLRTIRETGVPVAEHAAVMRANGYPKIAAAVEAAASGFFCAERIRAIRRELIALSNPVQTPELAGFSIALERVLHAWDEFEYGVGTAAGGEREVIS